MLIDGKRQNMNGRRAALTLANGKVPPKWYLAIAKNCDNRLCVNPEHSRLARVGEMRREMARNATASMRATWAKNGRIQGQRLAKLTPEQVEAIKNSDKSAKELAAEYGMSVSNMHRIRSGRSWREAGSGLAANSSVFNWKGAA